MLRSYLERHSLYILLKDWLYSVVSEYKEIFDDPTLFEEIDIATVRVAYPYFNVQLWRLEALG